MRRVLLLALLAAVVPASVSGSAAATSASLSCGLPETQPVWLDFADGSVTFWRERFLRPGIVVATGGPMLAAEARERGAATVHWDMYLRRRVGTPSEPADPSLMTRRADSLFEYAVSVSGCATPLIALNELWGASLPTPLTPTAEQYRANVLRFVSRLAERGGRPALLISSEPFTGGEAADWWRAVAAVSDLVLEAYANANVIWREGPINGQRRLRARYRRSAAELFAIGIPTVRVGLMIGFQTGPGVGGREGLQPRSRWFDVAKWQAFAAGQVARELDLAHVWSWGWAQRDERSRDPDKTYAACVWLWARDPGLCDAPAILGRELDDDRRTGQIDLPSGTRCVYGGKAISGSSVAALARLTNDRELALTALLVRAVESEMVRVSSSEIRTAERRIVAARFGGNGSAYRQALLRAGVSAAVGRGIVADELRRTRILGRLPARRSSAEDVARFRATHASVEARRVEAEPPPSWLPGGTGLALATSAPRAVFAIRTGRAVKIATVEGPLTVGALEGSDALGAVPFAVARPAILRELRSERLADAYGAWTIRRQKAAESRLVCDRDRLPELGVVRLSSFLPFLSMHEPQAAYWLASQKR